MTVKEHLLSIINKDEFAEWLNEHVIEGPWMDWWDEQYCNKCEPVECSYVDCEKQLGITPIHKRTIQCAWCELEHKCKYFPDKEDVPSNIDIINMWLKSKI